MAYISEYTPSEKIFNLVSIVASVALVIDTLLIFLSLSPDVSMWNIYTKSWLIIFGVGSISSIFNGYNKIDSYLF